MILIDANVLIGLIDLTDHLSTRAWADLKSLRGPFGVIDAALVETYHSLDPFLCKGIPTILQQLEVTHVPVDAALWRLTFDWYDKYAQHDPDICDALLIIAAHHLPGRHKIWTYDSEFTTIWRALDGTAVPLAVRDP